MWDERKLCSRNCGERNNGNRRGLWQIKEVTKLAKECVRVKGEERPTTKEVAMELERLQVVAQVEHFNLLDGALDKTSINVRCAL